MASTHSALKYKLTYFVYLLTIISYYKADIVYLSLHFASTILVIGYLSVSFNGE